jgi:hypothetical protein
MCVCLYFYSNELSSRRWCKGGLLAVTTHVTHNGVAVAIQASQVARGT